MAQKVIQWDNGTCQHMHLKLRWLKIRTIYFSLISCSKYWSRVFWPKWLTCYSSKKLRWPSQKQMHMLARDIVSSDDFLSHLTIPPYCKFCDFSIDAGKIAKFIKWTIPEVIITNNPNKLWKSIAFEFFKIVSSEIATVKCQKPLSNWFSDHIQFEFGFIF